MKLNLDKMKLLMMGMIVISSRFLILILFEYHSMEFCIVFCIMFSSRELFISCTIVILGNGIVYLFQRGFRVKMG